MKEQYTIHEIAELYGIGTDSLRYYERLGLIHPRRGKNGYRLYGLEELYRITIIRDLLGLGFHTEQIGNYLAELHLSNTLTMLEEERRVIRRRRQELEETERSIEKRMDDLRHFGTLPVGDCRLVTLPDRPSVHLHTDIRRDEEFDFAIKKLHHLHKDLIRDLGRYTMGASISPEDLTEERWGERGLFRSVFFVLRDAEKADFLLPGGDYAVLFYRGSYRQCRPMVERLRDWARERSYREQGEILELYHIDNRYTAREEEFVTELQLRVEK